MESLPIVMWPDDPAPSVLCFFTSFCIFSCLFHVIVQKVHKDFNSFLYVCDSMPMHISGAVGGLTQLTVTSVGTGVGGHTQRVGEVFPFWLHYCHLPAYTRA